MNPANAFRTLNWMHAHSRQTTLDFFQVKSYNGWQFDGDRRSQFIASNCCNGPLCVAELVHLLLCTSWPERYVITRYIFIYISIY